MAVGKALAGMGNGRQILIEDLKSGALMLQDKFQNAVQWNLANYLWRFYFIFLSFSLNILCRIQDGRVRRGNRKRKKKKQKWLDILPEYGRIQWMLVTGLYWSTLYQLQLDFFGYFFAVGTILKLLLYLHLTLDKLALTFFFFFCYFNSSSAYLLGKHGCFFFFDMRLDCRIFLSS